eukprot:TRINITY_DN66126_c1_g1_i5.p1 TRINITY_DN66126_c1_g1~~TRINITY_DN66126_c1_g1_i5.p1  ORF type:complete len:275 (-),score=25.75 TRINITY_DN66126_c1_g1_i5:80-904(-)
MKDQVEAILATLVSDLEKDEEQQTQHFSAQTLIPDLLEKLPPVSKEDVLCFVKALQTSLQDEQIVYLDLDSELSQQQTTTNLQQSTSDTKSATRISIFPPTHLQLEPLVQKLCFQHYETSSINVLITFSGAPQQIHHTDVGHLAPCWLADGGQHYDGVFPEAVVDSLQKQGAKVTVEEKKKQQQQSTKKPQQQETIQYKTVVSHPSPFLGAGDILCAIVELTKNDDGHGHGDPTVQSTKNSIQWVPPLFCTCRSPGQQQSARTVLFSYPMPPPA